VGNKNEFGVNVVPTSTACLKKSGKECHVEVEVEVEVKVEVEVYDRTVVCFCLFFCEE
jgi:hypothetical protein